MRGAANITEKLISYLRFLLTRLMRGAAASTLVSSAAQVISTHAPHARRGMHGPLLYGPYLISTHAPHARRGTRDSVYNDNQPISTHAPHARRGASVMIIHISRVLFLLTRLMRGAAFDSFTALCSW